MKSLPQSRPFVLRWKHNWVWNLLHRWLTWFFMFDRCPRCWEDGLGTREALCQRCVVITGQRYWQ